METRVISAHIPLDMAHQLDKAAISLDRPKGWIVKQALSSWLALEERRHQLTLQALESAATGKVVDHELVGEWVRSRPGRSGS